MPLVASMGVKLVPLLSFTALRHFFDKIKSPKSRARDDFLYDEVFTVVKSFLESASRHPVEELQEFSNKRIPVSPAVRSIRVMVPLSSCGLAAEYLIIALGGEEQASRVTGGTRWWQVRGLDGVDANWIVTKKDLESARKERLRRENVVSDHLRVPREDKKGEHWSDMNSMRCLYHLHGGGYFFGSVDQERYSMQRYARKINGRVFAINYRLAPQYPFPCALQDALAGYLYLIRPPPEASHAAIDPSRILFGGDSAGGGMVLALLQVIRDSGLPFPAAAILISPWGDLTHSFPSVFQNTNTDIIPAYGLNLYRPSPLWPPPSEEMDAGVKNVLTSSVRAAVEPANIPMCSSPPSSVVTSPKTDGEIPEVASKTLKPTTGQPPTSDRVPKDLTNQVHSELPLQRGEPLVMEVDGQKVEIKSQIHIYAMNHQLGHPLVSPALGYLGGLPPLYIMCGDKEVLRDEIIHMAHKAAHPERYPVKENTKYLYPALVGIEQRYGATDVHIQVYDGACHVLPLLPFSVPATFCYRAVAAFCKHFVKAASPLDSLQPPDPESPSYETQSFFSINDGHTSSIFVPGHKDSIQGSGDRHHNSDSRGPFLSRSRKEVHVRPGMHSTDFESASGMAGYPGVYQNVPSTQSPFVGHMIRERVSTRGILRPLESEENLPGCVFPLEKIGVINETGARRYLAGQALWEKKFSRQTKKVARQREKNLKLAKRDNVKTTGRLHDGLENVSLNSPLWDWGWALEGEDPPPSSIIARRDTAEARRLSKCADMRLEDGESSMCGNHLWALVVDHLSARSRPPGVKSDGAQGSNDPKSSVSAAPSSVEKRRSTSSVFGRFKFKHSRSRH